MIGFFVFKKFLLFSRFHRGYKKYPELLSVDIGEYGLKYDTPNELMWAIMLKWNIKQNAIPKNPAKYPSIIYANLIRRIWKLSD